jgi:maleate isomerase
MGYACLVAIMSRDLGYHDVAQRRIAEKASEVGAGVPVVTSAGALVEGLRALDVSRIALIAPYLRSLTELVVDYIKNEGIEVTDYIALEIADNLEVGLRDPRALIEVVGELDHSEADAVVLSACVQMPSLEAIQEVEDAIGKPVVSAAVCTVYSMLRELGLERRVPHAGALLSGRY